MPQDTLKLPALSLVLLIGSTGAGKSTFARRLFRATEIVSSDTCRGLVDDDENSLAATDDAFDLLHYWVAKRLKRGHLTVVDATNVRAEDRKSLVALARQYHCPPVAIVLDVPDAVAEARNRQRPERRHLKPHVVARHRQLLRQSLRSLRAEGFRHVFHLRGEAEVSAVQAIVREPLRSQRPHETGPFDIIGDIHGCYRELCELLARLGYAVEEEPVRDARDLGVRVAPPPGPLPCGGGGASRLPDAENEVDTLNSNRSKPSGSKHTASQSSGSPSPAGEGAGPIGVPWGRRLLFLGDLVDRGPASPQVLRLVMSAVRDGLALCVPGNHDMKLLRYLGGKNVSLTHGLAETVAQLAGEPAAFKEQVRQFLDGLTSHYVLDGERLVVAHAGLPAAMQGRGSGAVRSFALFGETTGETDEFGLPVRYAWAADYRGRATVVYGHTPVPEPEWLNNTLDIDTGCVFGGRLTALRYPERALVSVPAHQVYAEPARPLRNTKLLLGDPLNDPAALAKQELGATAPQQPDSRDLPGKQLINTRLLGAVTIREENAVAALEVLARFALHPKWLLYLPPTVSPTEPSALPGLLEHPAEAFAYYQRQGVERVVCEQAHLGSRVVVVLGQTEAAIQHRLGVAGEGLGKCYTRTGRSFFPDPALETAFLARLREALGTAGFWEKFGTDWVCLEAELLPWSAKAQELVRSQYAAVAADTLAEAHHPDCWPVQSLDDLRLAPFHLLATEGRTYFDRDHAWHLETLRSLSIADPGLLRATPYRVVPLKDHAEVEAATDWWAALTAAGGEGLVVKPYDFLPATGRSLVQPALKCRGPEYLRLLYGPDYLLPEHLERLRQRNVKAQRNLALREFALGVEGLERFVAGQPLRAVQQCVLGVLALESEPTGPRL